MATDVRALGRYLATELLQECSADLAVRLRDLLNDLPKVVLLLDRASAEDLVTKLTAAIAACDLVSHQPPPPGWRE